MKPKTGEVWEVSEDIGKNDDNPTSLVLLKEYDVSLQCATLVHHTFSGFVIQGEYQGCKCFGWCIERLIRRIKEAE